MHPFEPQVDFAHEATSSVRVVIFQRANSGVNSERAKNPMHGNAPAPRLASRS
jgi:hypothetical protein